MPRRFDRLDPQPPGFGSCGSCAYRRSGPAAICFTCALEYTEPNPSAQCDLCSQALQGPRARCLNIICDWDVDERWYGRVRAIAPHSGAMQRVIRRYKYDERKAWGQILGRVLLGFLDEHAAEFNEYNMIIPMPAYTGPGAHRTWAHLDLIMEHASTEDSFGWPFQWDPAVIVKTADTDTMTKKGWSTRHSIAVDQLRPALHVPDHSAVSGQRIVVVDDVFTTGHDMLEVARALRLAGAAVVDGLVLARAQWRQGV